MPQVHTKAELEQLKEFAKILYTRDRLTQQEVSLKTGVHFNTINNWVATGNWKKLQRNLSLEREEQLAKMLDELIELNNDIEEKPKGKRYADAKESAIRDRLVRNIKDLQSGPSLFDAVSNCKAVVDFFAATDLAKAREMSDSLDEYVQWILR